MKRIFLFIFIAVFFMNCSKQNNPSGTTGPTNDNTPILSLTGKIAFSSSVNGYHGIFILSEQGITQITNNSVYDVWPFLSPDGEKIVFTRFPMMPVYGQLWLYDLNTGNEMMLTTVNTVSFVSWSPDSSKIVFTKDLSGDIEIFKIDIDGNTETRLTYNAGDDISPEWSPNGNTILFCSSKDGNKEIYKMGIDGSSQTRLTNNSAEDKYPKWAPDGNKIAFVSYKDESHGEIYVMDADGNSLTRLTNNTAEDYFSEFASPWSPDGNKILFVSARDLSEEIYIMDADGNNQTRLTDTDEENSNPIFSPDGSKIAFLRWFDNGTNSEIYIMNKDGTGQTRFTNTSECELITSWR